MRNGPFRLIDQRKAEGYQQDSSVTGMPHDGVRTTFHKFVVRKDGQLEREVLAQGTIAVQSQEGACKNKRTPREEWPRDVLQAPRRDIPPT